MRKELTITISPPSIHSSIIIDHNLLNKKELPHNSFLIFPENLKPLIPAKILAYPSYQIPKDELIKSRRQKEKVEDVLYAKGVDKKTTLVGIGGGALLDFVGFLAATYMRGIPFISCPTTLLAMTDAAIGGKTGLNVAQGKNIVGSYYFPIKTLIDLHFLETLPHALFVEGLSESIKHALLFDADFFALLERGDIAHRELVERSVALKRAVVERDPFEKEGLRHCLNFGHTVGHALEMLSDYTLPHGKAVAMGMRIEAAMAMALGHLPKEDFTRINKFLQGELPDTLPFAAMAGDKKSVGGKPRFTALTKIGSFHPELLFFDEKLLAKGVHDARCSY